MTKKLKRFVYLVLSFMLVLTSILGVLRPASAANPTPVVKLSSLAAGDTVNFGGKTWIVLDPSTGYLLLKDLDNRLSAFDSRNYNIFRPIASIFDWSDYNIAEYLNKSFYNSLDSEDRPLIQNHSWGIGGISSTDGSGNESSSVVACNVGLISYNEWNNYRSYIGNPSQSFWTRTPNSLNTTNAFVVYTDGRLLSFMTQITTNAVRPALYLNPDIFVFGGSGGIVLGGKYHNVVSVAANPSSGGTVGGGGVYAQNDQVTVTASAYRGYGFVNWTNNGTEVSTDPTYSYTMGTADTTLVANFQNSCTPTITVVNGLPFSVTVDNTFGSLTGTNLSYPNLKSEAGGNHGNEISGTLSGLSTTTPTDIPLGTGKIIVKAVNPPSTTLVNASFY